MVTLRFLGRLLECARARWGMYFFFVFFFVFDFLLLLHAVLLASLPLQVQATARWAVSRMKANGVTQEMFLKYHTAQMEIHRCVDRRGALRGAGPVLGQRDVLLLRRTCPPPLTCLLSPVDLTG